MKKRITDLMDDFPPEEVGNILSQPARRKKVSRMSGILKAAAAAVLITVLGGGVVFAAYSDQGFLKKYLGFGEGDEEKAAVVVKEEQISTENEDYILSVEELTGDETTQMVLVKVEGKNEDGREYLRTHALAAPVFKTAQGSTDNWSVRVANGHAGTAAGADEGLRYYLLILEEAVGTGTLYFGEGLKNVDIQYDTDWYKEHESEILKLDIKVENTVSSSIILEPGEIEEGIAFDSIEIGHFFVKGEGTRANDKRLEMIRPIPEIAAVYEDGSSVIIIEGNMGYERDAEVQESMSNGYSYSISEKGDDIRFEAVFKGYLDVENVEEIQINGERYPVENK